MTNIDIIPPQNLMDEVGRGDPAKFREIGETYLQFFQDLCEIKPTDKILDVGCGVGRIAIPLTNYLQNGGTYDGFDISPDGIKWCQDYITPKYPNFKFQVSDIYNSRYNPTGKVTASAYNFPYDSGTFDLICLTSVFTHLIAADLENYLSEIARVLKSGGRCLITIFLLNSESLKLIDSNLSRFNFQHELDRVSRVINPHIPEEAIAYQEDFILDLYAKYGLQIMPPIRYGKWCGRTEFFSGQDIIIAGK